MSDASRPDDRIGTLVLFDRLLRQPESALGALAGEGGGPLVVKLLFGAGVCCAAYGLAAGFFQGGEQLLVTAVKAPLVVIASVILCLPSLYVFGSLATGEVPARRVLAGASAFAALVGLVLAGLLPVVWLFSVSSRSLGFIVTVHALLWLVVLVLARRVLRLAFPRKAARPVVGFWVLLLFVVSLQVATALRPLLRRPAGAPVVEVGRLFFLEHYGQILSDEANELGGD